MSPGRQLYTLHPNNHQKCQQHHYHEKHHSIQNRPPADHPLQVRVKGPKMKNHLSIISVELNTQFAPQDDGRMYYLNRQTITNCGSASDRAENLNAGGGPHSKVIYNQWEEHTPCSLNKSPVSGIFLHFTP